MKLMLSLKYYCFYNEGMEYDSDISDPDHNHVSNLSLQELEILSGYLMAYVKQKAEYWVLSNIPLTRKVPYNG